MKQKQVDVVYDCRAPPRFHRPPPCRAAGASSPSAAALEAARGQLAREGPASAHGEWAKPLRIRVPRAPTFWSSRGRGSDPPPPCPHLLFPQRRATAAVHRGAFFCVSRPGRGEGLAGQARNGVGGWRLFLSHLPTPFRLAPPAMHPQPSARSATPCPHLCIMGQRKIVHVHPPISSAPGWPPVRYSGCCRSRRKRVGGARRGRNRRGTQERDATCCWASLVSHSLLLHLFPVCTVCSALGSCYCTYRL